VTGDRELALRWTRRALDEEPNTVRAWLSLARLEAEAGRVEACRAAAAEGVERSRLARRSGLTEYELELLRAPSGELSDELAICE
jgi:hypothetical protein